MATYTTNYNLEKPAQTDIYNVDVFNDNADKIDAGLTDKAEKTMLAPVETTNSASRSYAKGEYFVYNNVLCCATTAIAAGGTIAIGTNCLTAPVGGELKSLRDALSNSITPTSVSFTPVTGVRYVTNSMFRYGNLVMGYMWIVISDTSLLARNSILGTFGVNSIVDSKPVLLKVDGNKTENCAFTVNTGNVLRVDNNWDLPSTGTYRGFICYRCG